MVAIPRIRGAIILASLLASPCLAQEQRGEWLQLFNGRDLTGWVVKIRGHDLGQNVANTFRVENGLLKVSYDGYGAFDEQFGHLFYRTPFSSYHLVVEYRFVGDWLADTPGWARRNSGVMLHAQAPETMRKDQDFPISIELQLLGGLSDGRPRPTANVCTPGTEIDIDGQRAASHCINSRSATYHGDGWVRVEAIVLGDSLIKHIVNGDTVLTYTAPRVGGGVVNGFDPAVKVDGTPLRSGYIALQSEGHPIEFRRVELRVLPRRPNEHPPIREAATPTAGRVPHWPCCTFDPHRGADRTESPSHAARRRRRADLRARPPRLQQRGFNTTEIGSLPLETSLTMNQSWGFNITDRRFKSTRELIGYLVRAAGNVDDLGAS